MCRNRRGVLPWIDLAVPVVTNRAHPLILLRAPHDIFHFGVLHGLITDFVGQIVGGLPDLVGHGVHVPLQDFAHFLIAAGDRDLSRLAG